MTGSRNAGAAASRGDVVVFADAHVDPSPGWLEALCLALDDPSVACAAPSISQIHQRGARGYGFTWREPRLRMRWLPRGSHAIHEVPFACGCLMAFRRDDFEAVGGFDEGLVRWGSEDAEIGLALWRRDRRTVVVPESVVAHLFRPVGPYVVPSELVVHNALRMATVHLGVRAVERVIASYEQLDCFPAAFARLVDSDVWARRDRLAAESAHDGEWFVDRFRIGALR